MKPGRSIDKINKVIGHCKVLNALGEGGMGTVYLARDLRLERDVALKIISPEFARQPGLMSRFRVEAIAQAKLNHPNIVTIHSFEEENDIFFIVMEYVDGSTLKQYITRNGPLPLESAIKVFRQLLEGIGYAHSRGVVHRDIKPSNIFISRDGAVKIGDFGIAKVEGMEMTKTGAGMGSPIYSSPEQIMGKKTDARTDIFSLGMTFYEIVTGIPAIKVDGHGPYQLIRNTLDAVPPKPSEVNPALPDWVERIIMACIAKDSAQRMPDVDTLIDELDRCSGESGDEYRGYASRVPGGILPNAGKSVSPGTEQGKPRTPVKKPDKNLLRAAALLSLILIVVILVLLFSNRRQTANETVVAGPVSVPSTEVSSGADGVGGSDPAQPDPKLPGLNPGTVTSPSNRLPAYRPEPPMQNPGAQPSTPSIPSSPTTLPTAVKAPEPVSSIAARINRLIRAGIYGKAVKEGRRAIGEGTVNGEIYIATAFAAFCDGDSTNARSYMLKALGLDSSIGFAAGYRDKNKRTYAGVLVISWKRAAFRQPGKPDAFNLAMSNIEKVVQDRLKDFTGLFKKKKNRLPELIIKDTRGNRYVIRFKAGESKRRKFVKFVVDELRKRH